MQYVSLNLWLKFYKKNTTNLHQLQLDKLFDATHGTQHALSDSELTQLKWE